MIQNIKYSFISVILLLCFAAKVRATDFVVTNVSDSGAGSLREAMTSANAAGAGPHTITFDTSISGDTILLGAPLPTIIVDRLTIDGIGDGSGNITIDAQGGDIMRDVFLVGVGGTNATITNFIIQNTGSNGLTIAGDVAGITFENIVMLHSGGDWYNNGIQVNGNAINLTIRNVLLTQKQSIGTFNNAAIYITGTATNVIIDNFVFRDSQGGVIQVFRFDGTASGITIQNCNLDLDYSGGDDDGNYGIYFLSSASNVTLNNVQIANADNYSMYVTGAASNFSLTDVTLTNEAGGTTAEGIHFQSAIAGLTMQNVEIDMMKGDATVTDDGNYGIFFNSSVAGAIMDSVTIRNVDMYFFNFTGAVDGLDITNSVFDNTYGGNAAVLLRFTNTVENLNLTNVSLDCDYSGSADDADYSIYISGATVNNVTMDSLYINEADIDGIYITDSDTLTLINSSFINCYDGIEFTGNYARENNVIQDNVFDANSRSAIVINVANAVTEFNIANNTFSNHTTNNGRALWLSSTGGYKDIDITGNTFYNNLVGIYNEQADGILYSQNSFYNNTLAIDNVANNGNLDYELADGDVPIIRSSVDVGGGNYKVTFTLPTLVEDYDVEFYTNDASDVEGNGRTYVYTASGLTSGTHTVTVNSGGNTDGYWTAILIDNTNSNNTSEFSKVFAINPKGPADVDNGIFVWLRADKSVVSTSDVVTEWQDHSGMGNTPTTVNTPDYVENTLNFNPAISFQGVSTDEYFNFGNITNDFTEAQAFVVTFQDNTDVASLHETGLWRIGGNNNTHVVHTDETIYESFGNNSRINGVVSPAGTDIPYIYSVSQSATNQANLYWDQQNIYGAAKTTLFPDEPIWLGKDRAGYRYLGDIAEFILYNRVLTATEQQAVSSYLAIKYGITLKTGDYLAGSGATIWNSSANLNYNNNIAGIGRNDASELLQKQSKSIYDDALITIGLGDIAESNAANTNSFPADESFLLWGSNGENEKYQVDYTPSTYTTVASYSLMNKVWKVQETGTVGSVKVSIPESFGANHLIVSTNEDLSSATEITLSSDGNGNLSAMFDFVGGEFFTFGKEIVAPGGVTAGLDFWFDPSTNLVTSGSSVTQWSDRSSSLGNDPVLAQTNASLYPTFNSGTAESNFNPYIDFTTNTRLYQTVTGSDYAKSHSIFAAYHNNQASPGSLYAHFIRFSSVSNSDGGTHRWGFGYNTYPGLKNVCIHYISAPFSGGTMSSEYNLSSYNQYNKSKVWATGTTGIVSATIDQAGSQTIIGFDGNESINNNVGIDNDKLTPLNNFTVGGGNTYGQSGWAQEIIEYSVPLSQADREKVNSYLAIKYGVTLEHNYYASDWDGTTGTPLWTLGGGFDNDIAGIGRDDASALNQKQSKSVNADAIVTMGLGEIAATNATNTNAFSTDKDFLVWGNNGLNTEFTVSYTPGSFTPPADYYRMNRIWKVQETGTVGTVKISIPASAKAQHLIVSANEDLSGATEIELASDGNGNLTADYDFSSGQYFTFGTALFSPGGVNSGVVAWLRADDGISAATWYDFSDNANDAVPTGDPEIVNDYYLNFNPVYFYDGNDGHTLPITSVVSTDFSMFTVSQMNGLDNQRVFQSAQGNSLFGYHNGTEDDLNISGGWVYNGASNTNITDPKMYSLQKGSSTNYAFKNVSTDIYTGTSTQIGTWQLNIGGTQTYNETSQVYVPEVIIYDRDVDDTEMYQIQTYLAIKYGFTLASNYLATNGSTIYDVSTYGNNVAGIGRDDTEALNQKQSKSVNNSSVVVMGLGGIAETNAANTNEFSTNQSYLLWGNNGGDLEYSNEYSSASYQERLYYLNRIWKVQETGTVGNVVVSIPDYIGAKLLLVSNSESFTAGSATEIELAEDGKGNLIATVNFSDGQYFTFAETVRGPGNVSASMLLWLRADDVTATSAEWINYSGANTDSLVQTTTDYQPQRIADGINYNYTFVFDGSNDYFHNDGMSAGTTDGTNSREIYVVAGNLNAASGGYLWNYGNYSGGDLHLINNTDNVLLNTNSSISSQFSKNNIDSDVGIFSMSNNDAESISTFRMAQNGAALSPTAVVDGTPNLTATELYIGVHKNTSQALDNYYNGSIAEYIIYNDTLTDSERNRVESYLALKYGVTLDQATPQNYTASDGITVYWDATTNAAYSNDIAGIGRDVFSYLLQKQSKSINSDALVAIGLGSVATSNSANTNTFSADKQFLVWGNDNGGVGVVNTAIPLVFEEKISRNWLVTETGSVGSVVVQIPVSAVSGFSNSAEIMMIVADDENFSVGVQTIQMTQNGSYLEATFNFDGTQYFSFGITASRDFMRHGKTFKGGVEQPMKF